MNPDTDTQRTDAMPCNKSMLSAQSNPVELYHKLITVTVDFGKALDACVEYRDQLAASQAEVERLKKELADWDYGTRAKREQERAEKAEAEVERLKKELISLTPDKNDQ